jgi:hypothetical protein
MKIETLSLVFSGIAVSLSLTTTWLTLLRRGAVRMTQPSLIFFGPDGSRGPAKVFVRAFMYSTSDRGRIVDQMFARLSHREGTRSFTSWIVRDGALSRGAGLLIDRKGVAHDHHFLLANGAEEFAFYPGDYVVELFGTCVGRNRPVLLTSQRVHISASQAESLNRLDAGIFFDWNPEKSAYHSRLDRNLTAELNAALNGSVRLPRSHYLTRPSTDSRR